MNVGDGSENQTTSPIRLLAICKSGDAIRPAITFLARRSVHITTVATMQEGLERLSKKDIDYVFLSVTFPHNKLETIPSLLFQTFGVETVFFAEKWDRRSEARMSQIKHKHTMFGPVSGPSIHLKLRQLEKAEAEADALTKPVAALRNEILADPSDQIEPAQPKAQALTENVVISEELKRPVPDAIAKLMKMLSDDNPSENSEDKTADVPKTFVAKGPPPKKLAPILPEQNKARGLSVFKNDPRIEKSPFQKTKLAAVPTKSAAQEKVAPAVSKKEDPIASAIGAVMQDKPMPAAKTEQKARVLPLQNNLGAPLKRVPDRVQGHSKLFLIWESARRAVMDVSKAVDVYDTAIVQIDSLAFMSITSPGVSGCFLLTIGAGSKVNGETLALLESRFLHHLREAGREVKDSEVSTIIIDSSTLPDGAFIDSDFSITAATQVAQLSISFLDIQHEGPEVEASALEDFSKIKVKDIATGVPLTFDAYIYMPLNQKTLKYLKQGGVLGLKQKSKLIDDGTEHLYIKENSVSNFRELHARTSLHEEFDKRKEAAKKKAA